MHLETLHVKQLCHDQHTWGHRNLERRVMEIEKKNSGFTLRMILIFPIALEMLYS